MGDDWEHVFGYEICGELTTPAAKLVAGLDPCDFKDRVKFGRQIGLLKAAVERIGDFNGGAEINASQISDDEEEPEEGDDIAVEPSTAKPKKPRKKFSTPTNEDWQRHVKGDHSKRIGMFFRWQSLQRPLVMPSMITGKRRVYNLWNILLSTVTHPPGSIVAKLTDRLLYGQRDQISVSSRRRYLKTKGLKSSTLFAKPVLL